MERKEMQSQIREFETTRHHQRQMEPLQWEACLGQMEQQVAAMRRPHFAHPGITGNSPIQHTANPSPVLQQGETEAEQQLRQQLQELKLKHQKMESSQPRTSPHAPQDTMVTRTAQQLMGMTSAADNKSKRGNVASVLQSAQQGTTEALMATLPSAPQGSVGSTTAIPSAIRTQAPSSKSKQVQHQEQHRAAPAASRSPLKTAQLQHQLTSAGPTGKVGSVPLPSGACNHFFLSHCQATGGDQTNAIYLELRQLGFSCWYSRSHIHVSVQFCAHISRSRRYDNRATDLTKDGMRHGIEGAAAFLVFLSEGILDRPFCE